MISVQYSVLSVQRRASRAARFAFGLFRHGRTSLWLGVLLVCLGICDSALADELIPESKIVQLEEEFKQRGSQGTSAVASRRALKNVLRKGQALLKESPEAPNRFRVLGIIFECQKRLLAIHNSESTRNAFFDTSAELAKAPDEYAEVRLEAELMLSEKELSERGATLKERAEALAAMLERYKDTVAEAKSLMMAALIVQKLDSRELERAILYKLDEEYSDDHEVIEFRRKHLRVTRLDLSVSGKFELVDGTELVLPSDTIGHMCLMVFWSKHKGNTDAYLKMMKGHADGVKGVVDVFSLNVDDLPDAGASILKEKGLDWKVVRLPGGRRHQAYRTYANGDPVAVLVNEYGFTVIRPEIVRGTTSSLDGSRLSEPRYSAQLQSLFIGDFLIADPASRIPDLASQLSAIQACFVPPPFRYRLKREEVLANYSKAVELCDEILKQGGGPEDVWRVRDRKIIALLGMWNLATDSSYLEKAIKEAKVSLAEKLPAGGDVVSRFCLAKAALRDRQDGHGAVVKKFVEDCGGNDISGPGLAAAAILALEARSRELHDEYRAELLEKHSENPALYDVTAYLRDRHHQHRLLNPNHTLRESRARWYIVGHGIPWPTNTLPSVEFKKLDGSTLTLPADNADKLTLLVFIEPPADGTNDFPVIIDSHGRRHNGRVRGVMEYAESVATKHINKDVNFITAFLTDNTNHVSYLVKTNGWSCEPVMVPGGLKNPMVRQLGVVSADRLPNVFLLRRDGTIAWHGSGLSYKNEFGFPFAYWLAMKVHVEVCEVEHAYRALAKGDYKEAARVFAGPYEAWNPDRYGWRSPRYHGRALALMALKDWEKALGAADKAIDAHKLRHFHGHGRRSKHAVHWRKDAARVTIKKPCDVISGLWAIKADILGELGRKDEAATFRKRSQEPTEEEYPHIYKLFHQRLNALRLKTK